MYTGIRVKYPLFLSEVNQTWIFSTDLGKYSNTNFHENPSSESRPVLCGETEKGGGGGADLSKLKVAFRNFANAPREE